MSPLDDDSLDAAVRRAAEVHDALVERVARAALTQPEARRSLAAWVAVAALLALCAAGLRTWWPHSLPAQTFTIETSDGLIVVRAADGTTFIASVQPGADLPQGSAVVLGGGGTR